MIQSVTTDNNVDYIPTGTEDTMGKQISDEELVAEIQAGINVEANQLELLERSKYLAMRVIKKMAGCMLYDEANFEDYMQQCFLAVMIASKRYEPKGAKFKTVLYNYMMYCIGRYNGNTQCVQIPPSMIAIAKKYGNYLEQYKKENKGKNPTPEEIKAALGLIRKSDYKALMVVVNNAMIASLDEYVNPDGFSLYDILESEERLEDAVCHSVYLKELHKALADALMILTEKQRLIIRDVYYNGASKWIIADTYGISVSAVYALIKRGFDLILLNGKTREQLESFMPDGYKYSDDKLDALKLRFDRRTKAYKEEHKKNAR